MRRPVVYFRDGLAGTLRKAQALLKAASPPPLPQNRQGASKTQILALQRGDRVHFRDRRRLIRSGQVICCDRDGFHALCDDGSRHDVIHADLIARGAGGSI